MRNNLVLISHSSKTDAALTDAAQFRKKLLKLGYDAQLDFRTIKGGEDWNSEIDHWMDQCSAAVLLLSKEALVSPWVLKEATILRWRKRFDPDLVLAPVLIGGVTKKQFSSSKLYRPLDLPGLQIIEAATAMASLSEVRKAIPTPGPAVLSETEQIVNEIAGLLSHMTELQFSNVFGRLEMPMPPWRPHATHTTVMAQSLARRFLTMKVFKVHEIVGALGANVAAKDKEAISQLISAFWANAAAAKLIPDACEKTPSGSVALNGNHLPEFTTEAYVRRAFWPDGKWEIIHVDGGEGIDYVGHVVGAIRDHVSSRMFPSSRQDPEALLRQTHQSVLALLPDRHLVDHQSLAALRQRFPQITFILGTGEQPLSGLAHDYKDITQITPPVDITEEYEAQRAFLDAIFMLRST